MLKNITGQNITAVLLDTAGAVVTTGTTTVYVLGNAGTQASMGTATHKGNGQWSIDVTQAESDYDDIGFLWVNTGAVTVNQHVFTDQSYDRLGAPAGASVSADLVVIDNFVDGLESTIGAAGAGLTNLGASGNNWNVGKTGYSLTVAPLTAVQVNAEVDSALADYDSPTNTEMTSAFTEIKGATWAGTDTLEGIFNASGGGTGLTAQETRDAMKLAPTVGAPAAGSVDLALDNIETDTTTNIPASIAALNNIAATDIVSGGAINTTTGAVDTVTTNTDMRGTDGANTVVPLNSTSIRAAIGLTLANLDDQLAAAATATGFSTHSAADVRTELDANSTKLAEITAARMATLTDWINGGRLDLLLDAIALKTAQLTFTKANEVDVSVQSVNGVTITGDGSTTPFDV